MERQTITLNQSNNHGPVIIKAKEIVALRQFLIPGPDPREKQVFVFLANSNLFFQIDETLEEIEDKIQELAEDMRPW